MANHKTADFVHQLTLEDKEKCYNVVLNQSEPNDGRLYCYPVWDGWGCWNYTLAGTTAFISCPGYRPAFDSYLTASRICNPDGSWWQPKHLNRTWSDYTTCINEEYLLSDKRVIFVYIAGYSVSIIALLVSLVLFFSFRQLNCNRITIHKNLFISYVFNGLIWIFYYALVSLNAEVLHFNPLWCRALHVLTQYFLTCNYFWMFSEGFFLHTIIVFAFTSGKNLLVTCILIGWVIPIIPVTVYAGVRAFSPNQNVECWLPVNLLSWIVSGPVILTVAINLAFLINIVRVLVSKMSAVNSPDTNQYKKAARATLILIPLLGLQYVLFPMHPDDDGLLKDVLLTLVAIATSLQGFFVALLFCFCNGEVISIVKRKWRLRRQMKNSYKRRGSASFTQTSLIYHETSLPQFSSTVVDESHRSPNACRQSTSGSIRESESSFQYGGKRYKESIANDCGAELELLRQDRVAMEMQSNGYRDSGSKSNGRNKALCNST